MGKFTQEKGVDYLFCVDLSVMLCFLSKFDLSSLLIYPVEAFFVVSFTWDVYRSVCDN